MISGYGIICFALFPRYDEPRYECRQPSQPETGRVLLPGRQGYHPTGLRQEFRGVRAGSREPGRMLENYPEIRIRLIDNTADT